MKMLKNIHQTSAISIELNHWPVVSQREKGLTPSNIFEILFYGYLFYATISTALGIYIPLFAGGLLAFLTLWALFLRKWKHYGNYAIGLILMTSILYVSIQNIAYDLPVTNPYIKPFLFWPAFAIVIDNLIKKEGFIKRLAVIMLIISLFLWPSVIKDTVEIPRARLESSTGLDNSNQLAAWIGFHCLIFWLWGIKQNSLWKKYILWGLVLLSFALIVQTVSRGALTALFAAVVVSLKRTNTKNRILIVVSLCAIIFLISGLPFFVKSYSAYQSRMYAETGRLKVWPAAVESIMQKPFTGYGADKVGLVTSEYSGITPHNAILFLWFTSGILPVIPLAVMWIFALKSNIKVDYNKNNIDALPLLIYAFIEISLTNFFFMSLWTTTIICYCLSRKKRNISIKW